MGNLNDSSVQKLMQCHEDLQTLANVASTVVNFVVTDGYRGKDAQEQAFISGKSKLQYPESKHNALDSHGNPKSLAFDFAPNPIDYKDSIRFYYVSGVILGVAAALGIKVRTGADFDRDGNPSNEKFRDLGHIELG